MARRSGAGAARNAGIRAAQGEWIAFLDADDEWLPEKLEKQIAAARDDQCVIFCASLEFAPDGTCLGDTLRGQAVDCSPDAWKSLLKANFIATPTVMAPRNLLLQLGGFDESLRVGEDQDLWIRLAAAARLTYVPETLVHVHVQPASLSAYRAQDQSHMVLPMIEHQLMRFAGRLSPQEVQVIRGERFSNAGRIALSQGDVLRGVGFMLRAWQAGRHPGALVKASLSATAHRLFRAERQLAS